MVHATQIAQIVPAMIVASLWLVTAGNAERQMQLQEVQEDSYPFITEIPAPDAAELAVSEAARLVAVRYNGENADQVSIFSLDKTGALTGAQPISLVLPKRELAEHPNYALGLTFHPSLPLLYVWQDVTVPDDAMPVLRLQTLGQASIDRLANPDPPPIHSSIPPCSHPTVHNLSRHHPTADLD